MKQWKVLKWATWHSQKSSAKRSLNSRYCEFFSHIEIIDHFQQRRDLVETMTCHGFSYNCDSCFFYFTGKHFCMLPIFFLTQNQKFQILLHVGFGPDRTTDFRWPCVFLHYICHCILIIFVWLLLGSHPLLSGSHDSHLLKNLCLNFPQWFC